MAYESLASILGAEGERKTRRARRRYDRTIRRRRQRQARQRRQRHARQRRELRQIAEEVIPRLERRETRLSAPSSEVVGLLGEDPELRRQRRLAEVESHLEAALAERAELAGKIRRRRGRRAEPVTLAEAGLALGSALPPVRGGALAAAGFRALFSGGAKKGAIEAAEQTVKRGLGRTAAKTKEAARAVDEATSARGLLRGARGRRPVTRPQPAKKTTPRGTRGGRGRRAGRVAGSVAKGGARAVTFPIRRPIKTAKYSFAAQAPAAIASGDLSEFEKVLTGEGVAATALRSAGELVSRAAPGEVATNLVKDVFDLPAQTVPAIYMPIAGVVEAAQGDSSRLEKLWADYKKVGLLPAVAAGDPDRVLSAIKEHPLFAALEARGAQAVVGRGAGAALRAGAAGQRGKQIGSTQRKPLRIGGRMAPKERRYSPDVIEKGIQVIGDVRRGRKRGGQKASPRERERILRERVDRIVAQEEGARRAGRSAEAEGAKQSRPKRSVDRDAVSLAAQGIVRSPRTFREDLSNFARQLDEAAPGLTGGKLKANRALRARVEKIGKKADPEAVFASARENVGALRAIDRELVETGVLAADQAQQARLIPFARSQLGAEYGLSNRTRAEITKLKNRIRASDNETEIAALRGKIAGLRKRKQIIDRDGDALPPARIEELRRQMGGEETAFISQSPSARGPGSFYRSMATRQTLPKKRRSGKATTEGTFDASFDAIAEQRMRGRGIVDAIHGFDRTAQEFAVAGRRYKKFSEAEDAARNPEAFGLPTDIPLKPVRLAPLRASGREVQRAEEIFDALDSSQQGALEATVDGMIAKALEPGPGPVVLLPEQVVNRLREHFQAATTTRRAAQVISSAFKGVVLPLSPNWFLGNFIDVSMRSMLAGTVPWGRNAALGRRLLREVEKQDPEMSKRVKAGLVPGMLYGAADATRVFRDARQFVGTALAPMARALGAARRTPGVKQTVSFYVGYRNTAFKFNERFIERQAQYALLGKAARQEVRSTTGKWHKALKLGDDAIADLARGLLKTPKQIQYAKAIEETLGQWTANSPGARALLVDYAPFGMWTRAASRFVLWTLPVKHPIKTAIAAAAYEMTKEERESLGLSLFVDKALPANLQGSIPLPGGGLIAPQTLTTFGFFADYQQSLANSVLPQFPLAELAGLDWTGDRLTHEDGTPLQVHERAGVALVSMGEAYLPFVALAKRAAEGGPEALVPRSVRPYDRGLVDWLREQSESREITVPVEPEGSYNDVFEGGGGGSGVDYGAVFGGGWGSAGWGSGGGW